MSTLNVVPAHVGQFAASHDEVAAQIAAAAHTEGSRAAMAAAYGPAGASVAAAAAAFEDALKTAGGELACNYRQMAEALQRSAELFVTTDASGAARFAPPAAG